MTGVRSSCMQIGSFMAALHKHIRLSRSRNCHALIDDTLQISKSVPILSRVLMKFPVGFPFFRRLRCVRNRIHINLFCAIIIRGICHFLQIVNLETTVNYILLNNRAILIFTFKMNTFPIWSDKKQRIWRFVFVGYLSLISCILLWQGQDIGELPLVGWVTGVENWSTVNVVRKSSLHMHSTFGLPSSLTYRD